MEIMGDIANPEHLDMVKWFGARFDPTIFNLSESNARIQRVRK
jgi:hypothetical protein